MQTIVVNKHHEPYDVYIGRGSPFGNPYSHLSSSLAAERVASRSEAIERYRGWFLEQMKSPAFMRQVLALEGKRLGCYCKPLACHGDVIVEWLENYRKTFPKRLINTYRGWVTMLESDEVFVFGSNLDGFHGAGSAGYASFGVAGNHWREYDYANKPNGWKGKWNVKGIAEGYQVGNEGASYAIPTVTKAGAKRSRTPEEIEQSIRKLYLFACKHPELEFLVAQENKVGLNGYKPEEMAEMFSCALIPKNVLFEEGFAALLYN